jgi:hypothetical protein
MNWKWLAGGKWLRNLQDKNQKQHDRIRCLTEQRDKARLQRDRVRGGKGAQPSAVIAEPTRQGSGTATSRIDQLERALAAVTVGVDLLKSKLECPAERWHQLQELRREQMSSVHPLVSVCISTHNRVELLTTRALPSILKQTYQNLEIIVVADGCDDGTIATVENFRDDRIRLHQVERNLPHLDEAKRRWMVSGSRPNNVAQTLATGDFVTHLDDDDEHLPERIALLVDFAMKENADMVYHPFYQEGDHGNWAVNQATDVLIGQVTTSSIFYRNWLKHIPWDLDTHLLGEPADWNRIRRMVYAGAKCVRYPEPLLRHFRERNQASTRWSPEGSAVTIEPIQPSQPPTGQAITRVQVTAPTAVPKSRPGGVIHIVGKFDFGLRHDWGSIMDRLADAYGGGPVAMVSGVDWQLMSGEPFPDPWVGVFHQPFASHAPCVGLFDLKARLEQEGALKSCRGLFVLTDFQKQFLEDANLGVPVELLWHPTVFEVRPWSPQQWLADRRIVFLGRWIRRCQSIQDLQCPGVRKLWLAKQSEPIPGVEENGSVERVGFVDAGAYDALLTGCVAMTDVIEAAANNVVLECIARSTPLLVNWNSGIVEYLGPDYPLYYSSIAEANWKATSQRLILAAHEYLLNMDKSRFTVARFVQDFGNSQIFRSLPSVPGTEPKCAQYRGSPANMEILTP